MGDELEEFAEFYQAPRDGCLRAVYASVGDRLLSEDLVAEAYARAWASWRKLSRHPAPPAWVVRTALKMHVSWWRRRRREVSWESRGATDAPPPPQADARVDEQVLAAVRSLPLRQRELITLRVFLDLDTETTARTLAIAPGAVTAHLSLVRDLSIGYPNPGCGLHGETTSPQIAHALSVQLPGTNEDERVVTIHPAESPPGSVLDISVSHDKLITDHSGHPTTGSVRVVAISLLDKYPDDCAGPPWVSGRK